MTLLTVMEQHCVRYVAVTHEIGKDSNEDKLPENNPNAHYRYEEKKCN